MHGERLLWALDFSTFRVSQMSGLFSLQVFEGGTKNEEYQRADEETKPS